MCESSIKLDPYMKCLKKVQSVLTMSSTPSFRFNAQQEELIELMPDEPEQLETDQPGASSPSDVSGTRDGSPFRRFGKRSTSVDTAGAGGDGMVADHPWSFLHGIREKIEDKLDEMKKERQQKLNEKKLSMSKQTGSEASEPPSGDDGETLTPTVAEKKMPDSDEKEKREKVGDSKESSGTNNSKDTKHDSSTPTLTHSTTTGNKMKSKFADLKRKFKSESETTTEEKEGGGGTVSTVLPSVPAGPESDEDGDFVEMAQEAGADDTLRAGDHHISSSSSEFHTKLAFSYLPTKSCRAPGLIESLGTLAVSNMKAFLLSVALMGMYFSVYPLLVAFLLGSLFAMELSSILDWIRETFFLWTDSNSEYLITTNPYLMTQPVPIFDPKTMKPLQPHKLEHVGWLNEFKSEYSPERYHLSLTETVYAQLQGSLLRISEPRVKIPRRAVWNEPHLKLLFNVARLYNISNCQVLLLPKGIIRQRIWNRKYPICIVLRSDSHVGMKFRPRDQPTIAEEEPWLPFEITPDTKEPLTPSSAVQSEGLSGTAASTGGKMKSKSTESFLTLHETLKHNLEKSKEEAEAKARKPGKPSPDSEVPSKPNVPVRRKRSAPRLESEIKEENAEEVPDSTPPVKPSTLDVPKSTSCETEEEEEETELEEELCDGNASPDLSFHLVEHGDTKVECLYLFARTDRDKELWYRRLKAATSYYSVQTEDGAKTQHFLMESDAVLKHQEQNESYVKMMAHLHQSKIPTLPPVAKETAMPRTVTDLKDEGEVASQLMFLNALIGRSLFDVFRNTRLRAQIQAKLQRKLNAIRLPRFLGQLNISKLEFSNNSPVLTQASTPRLDENGIWFELDVVFEGRFRIQVDTKLILMNLKKPSKDLSMSMLACDNPSNPSSPSKENPPSKLAALHSDIEDSGETSSDNDEKRLKILADQNLSGDLMTQSESSAGLTPNRMLRMVDKITSTRMFDKFTDNAYVRKIMQEVANTDISLFVELRGLAGRLVLNIPPPPSDRLWYGFKGNPRLWLTAYPKFGDKELSVISSILQKTICTEFQKVVVLPNMDDFVLEGLVEDPLS